MAHSKFFAGSFLTLSLLIPCTHIRANFSTLTETTRSEIIHDSAIAGLAAGAIAGSLALASDISSQAATKRTFLQKLQHVDWSSVLVTSVGFGTLGAVVCGVYKYYNAPEWAFNGLSDRYQTLHNTINSAGHQPVVQAVMNNDGYALEKLCAQETFPLVASVDRLDQAIKSTACLKGYSGAELADIKKDLEALSHCRVPEVAEEAGKLFRDLNAGDGLENLNSFLDRMQDWVIRIKNNPLYVMQVKEKADVMLKYAQADSARRIAEAQQRIANAEQTKANARLIEALRPPAPTVVVTPAPVIRPTVVIAPAPVVRPTIVKPAAVILPRPKPNIVILPRR